MNHSDMHLFVDISVNFFEKITGEPASIAEGQLQFGRSTLLDHNGLIRISGSSEGVVCLSMPSPMIVELLQSSGETVETEEAQRDLVGEAANIIASNARKHFGSGFGISPPVTIEAGQPSADWPYSRFALPIRWRDHQAVLLLALHQTTTCND
jgi:CheY-specific phosphatase CheX